MSYRDKVAFVTGGTSGIGQAIAEALARRGAVVTLAGRNVSRGEDIAAALRSEGRRATAVKLDVTDAAAVRESIEAVADKHGRLDYVFNNAGAGIAGDTHLMGIDDWRWIIDVDLLGVVNGVVSAYPLMVRQGFGHIVNTASLGGVFPSPKVVPYITAKYGVVGLSTALRAEAAWRGVKVSVVCPGFVRTPIADISRYIGPDPDKSDRDVANYAVFWHKMDPFSVTPERCASIVLRGVERNRAMIIVTPVAWLAWRVHALSPGLGRGLAGIWGRRLEKHMEDNR